MDIEHEKYCQMRDRILKRKFQIARNQARFRDQEWTLTLEEFYSMWESHDQAWLFSGQGAEDYNLSRIDMDLGWTPENVHVIPRREMLANQGAYRRLTSSRKKAD